MTEKLCSRCEQNKPAAEFYHYHGVPQGWCRPCGAEHNRLLRASKPKAQVPCPGCGSLFTRTASRKKYCTPECGTVALVCKWCSVNFRALRIYRDRGQFDYCSVACRHAAARDGLPPDATRADCATCGATFTFAPASLRNGQARRHCSLSCYRRSKSPSGLEIKVRQQLESIGLAFEAEARVGRWSVDFLSGSLAIEADGEYWHSRPSDIERDARKDARLADLGYTVVRLRENDVNTDPSIVARTLLPLMHLARLQDDPTRFFQALKQTP